MCEQKQVHRKAIKIGIYERDLYLIREFEKSHRRVRKNTMSKKERKEAIALLLYMVREHEGSWNANRIIAELALEQGLRRKTVEEYVGDLIIAQRIERKGENLYIIEKTGEATK